MKGLLKLSLQVSGVHCRQIEFNIAIKKMGLHSDVAIKGKGDREGFCKVKNLEFEVRDEVSPNVV
jgi:hypothetical protein